MVSVVSTRGLSEATRSQPWAQTVPDTSLKRRTLPLPTISTVDGDRPSTDLPKGLFKVPPSDPVGLTGLPAPGVLKTTADHQMRGRGPSVSQVAKPKKEKGYSWVPAAFKEPFGLSARNTRLAKLLWALGGGYRVAGAVLGSIGAFFAAAVDVLALPVAWALEDEAASLTQIGYFFADHTLNAPKSYQNLAAGMELFERYGHDGVSFPKVLREIAGDEAAIEELTQGLAEAFGAKVPRFLLQRLLMKPELFLRVLVSKPSEVREVFGLWNEAYAQGQIGNVVRDYRLESFVDLNTFDASSIEVSTPEPKRIGPNLFYGGVKSSIPAPVEQQRRLWAEVLDRLAANIHAPDDEEKFRVKFGDRVYSDLRSFLRALEESGHQLKVTLHMKAADISDLSQKNEQGEYIEIAAPAYGTTGVQDEKGREALLPYIHFELSVDVLPPPEDGDAPVRLEGNARWYQGITSIGFFPGGISDDASWTNGQDLAVATGETALRTILDAAYYGDLLAKAAVEKNLRSDGYGVFGYCGDSILVAFHSAVSGDLDRDDLWLSPVFRERIAAQSHRNFAFPYMINKDVILPEIERRLAASTSEEDAELYRGLKTSVEGLVDHTQAGALGTEESATLALDTLDFVWPDGQEPFESVVHAKRTLRAFLQGTKSSS